MRSREEIMAAISNDSRNISWPADLQQLNLLQIIVEILLDIRDLDSTAVTNVVEKWGSKV